MKLCGRENITKRNYELLNQMVDNKMTIREICKHFDLSKSTIHEIIHNYMDDHPDDELSSELKSLMKHNFEWKGNRR